MGGKQTWNEKLKNYLVKKESSVKRHQQASENELKEANVIIQLK